MHTAPTVIVLAHTPCAPMSSPTGVASSPWSFHSLLSHLGAVLESGLPAALVASPGTLAATRTLHNLDQVTLITLDDTDPTTTQLSRAVRIGVQTCASSPGWILSPAERPAVRGSALREIARLMPLHPVVYANAPVAPGMPMGVSPELFSELMRIHSERDLLRLINRYPSMALEVDAVGALIERSVPEGALPSPQPRPQPPSTTSKHD